MSDNSTAQLFSSARSKVKRANLHIDDLKSRFGAFIDSQPYELVAGISETGEATAQMTFNSAIPDGLSLIVGDAVHNLRAALDHLAWELVGRDGGKRNSQLAFPTGKSQTKYESRCEELDACSSVIDLLKTLEVFPDGKGSALYKLHRLDIGDKHFVLTPIVGIAKASLQVIYPNGNVQSGHITVWGTDTPLCTIGPFARGARVQLDKHSNPKPDIHFGDGEAFRREPIIPTLLRLSEAVTVVVDKVANATEGQ